VEITNNESAKITIDKNKNELEIEKDRLLSFAEKLNDKTFFFLFKKLLINETADFYRKKATLLFEEKNSSNYIKNVVNMIEIETLRGIRLFHPYFYEILNNECELQLIYFHLEYLHVEFSVFLFDNQTDELRLLFNILKNIKTSFNLMVEKFEQHLVDSLRLDFLGLIENKMNIIITIESILVFHDKYLKFIEDNFQNNKIFLTAFQKIFTAYLNSKNSLNSCEYLVDFYDQILRKKPSAEIDLTEKLLKSFNLIFRFLNDKDYFQKLYWNALAKRLIEYRTTLLFELEEYMINLFKNECGLLYTINFKLMITDLNISSQMVKEFDNILSEKKQKKNVTVFVLRTCSWPLSLVTEESIKMFDYGGDRDLVNNINLYEQYYNSKFKGRKLNYIYSLCEVDVKLNYSKKKHIIKMNYFQFIVFTKFHNSNILKLHEIIEESSQIDEQVIAQLDSLCNSNLIHKHQMKIEVIENNLILFNSFY
jgi:hypothetical protein